MGKNPNPLTILAIDDDETVTMQVEAVLGKAGYNVITATNGEDGLQRASSETLALIVLDRRMPGMDGMQVLLKLKSDAQTMKIPVIMLTGDSKINEVSECLEHGAADYVVKPFSSEAFLIRAEKAIKGK